ncbi:unnamed protein product [Medioppia subpectinata]|uniref:Methyltransferase domain-containing protein n=1 Tax=Medioppia subpectinata TaxID=1979941 RepID=A0A7R9L2U1_9ACAR|nr:unnamed protein product [Medioppia subpectinata]CAG2114245.1 unnamed protein product [Medioppia subpectinata]
MNVTAIEYEKNSTGAQENARQLVSKLVADNREYDIIVDMGCGTGYMTELLAKSVKHNRIIGVDFTADFLSFAEQNHKPMDSVEYLLQDMSKTWDEMSPVVKALESKVSLIVSNRALHFFENKPRLMHVMSRLLVKNGSLVATYPLTPDLMSRITDEEKRAFGLQSFRTPSPDLQLDDMVRACESTGFQVLDKQLYLYEWHLDAKVFIARKRFPQIFVPLISSEDNPAKQALIQNLMFDVALNPNARRLNPDAIAELGSPPTFQTVFYIPLVNLKCIKL